jgi:molybdopterin synthase catalytic subunit
MSDLAIIRRSAIHEGPLPAALFSAQELASPDYGALCSFVGVVRNHAKGRAVTALHYECYGAMTLTVLDQLIAEAAQQCDPALSALITHGYGPMLPGDASVAIHVASAHRDAAFTACRLLIERLKQDVPVWKRETYADGTTLWIQGS